MQKTEEKRVEGEREKEKEKGMLKVYERLPTRRSLALPATKVSRP